MPNYLLLLISFSFYITSCNSSYKNLESKSIFFRKGHYGYDIINLRVNNKFTRENSIIPFSKKEYFGVFKKSNDTLYFTYEGNNKIDNELTYYVLKADTLTSFKLYDRIKEEYSNYSKNHLSEIVNTMKIDTASIQFVKK